MFGCVHLPNEPIRAAVLVCSPFQCEFLANYRREVLLADALAARGVAVGRFHYRGTGHSDGESSEVTFDTARDDAAEAMKWLSERAQSEAVGFIGTRWGALVAAQMAAGTPKAPLALWEPALDGRRYFREVFRFRAMAQLSGGSETHTDPFEEMQRVGFADVSGFPIDRAIFESSSERQLSQAIGALPRQVLLLQVDRRRDLRAEYAELVDRLNERGIAVDVQSIVGEEAWWFPGSRWQEESAKERSKVMVELTVDWFSKQLPVVPR